MAKPNSLANPIKKLGKSSARSYTKVPNELVRHGVAEMGSDALAVMLFLMSQPDGYQTSAVRMTRMFGWGRNTNRARNALAALSKNNRVAIREYQNPGGGRVYAEYVLYADGHKMTDAEKEEYSATVVLPGPCTETVGGQGR